MGDFAGFHITKDQGHFYYERQDATVNTCFVHRECSACDVQYITEKYVTPKVIWIATLLPESTTTLLSNVSIFFLFISSTFFTSELVSAFVSVECSYE